MLASHYKLFDSAEGTRHCVSERANGQPLEGSLALHTGQDAEQIRANRSKVAEYFGEPPVACIAALQVHGDRVHAVDRPDPRGWDALDQTFEADALITHLPHVVLTILTADCVPILLHDPVRHVIGAVHAGWRGTQQEIARKTIAKMGQLYGTNPKDLIVGIGPAIGGCCYEVGDEVAEYFTAYPDAVTHKGDGTHLLDTKQVNAMQLEALGVPRVQIEISPYCTACDVDRFFSYRAEQGTVGRFMSCIMLEQN